MKNLFFFNQRSNAAAQATECAYTTGQKFGVNPTKTSTFGRLATYIGLVLVMLVTLGVEEMKGDNGGFYNVSMSYKFGSADWAWIEDTDNGTGKSVTLGTLSSGTLKVGDVYLKCWDDWGENFKSSGGQMIYTNKGGSEQYLTGFTRSSKSGNNYDYHKTSCDLTIANSTDASGSYALVCWYQTWGDNWGDKYFPTSSGNYTLNYKIAPPAVNEGNDFIVAPSNKVSGTGTSADPFIISYGNTTAFTVTANKEHADANSKLKVSWNNGSSWSTGSLATTTSLTSGSYTPDGTKRNITIKVKFNNSTASLDGAVASRTIYYIEQTPGLTVAAGSNGKVRKSTSDSWATSALISPIEASTAYNIYAQADDHYDFKNWTSSDATHTTFGSSTSASTTATLSDGYGAVTTVTANFVEHSYTITIVGGTAASTTAKIVTTGTATAKAPFGMHFTGWTVPNSNFTLVGCTTSDETITFNATATGTVTANFAQTHAYIEGRFHVTNASRNGSWTNTFSAGDWQEDSRSIEFSYDSENHYYYLHTYATPKELTTNISDLTPWFYIKSSPSTSSWTNATVNRPHASGDANQQLTAAGDANKKSADGTSGSNSFRFNSTDESGYVVIGFKKFGITYDPYIYYWLEQTLEYNGNSNTGGSAPASKTYYDKGTSVQAKSNTYTKSGYSFSGWNTKANGSGSSVAASAWYTLNANTTFYAQWSENDYTVTVNAGTGGTVGASLTTTTITGHKDSKADLPTATPDPGYYFTGWTKTSGSVTFYNQSSANTAQVNGLTAAATVQANFAPLWALAGGLDGGSDWNVNDNKFTTYTTNASSHDEGQLSKSFDANSTYWVKLRNIQNSASYGLASGAATTNVYYATSSTGWTMTNASGNQKLYVHTAAAGTYDFYWDIETNQLYVHYPTSRYITSGQSDANGGTVTAVDGSSNNVWGGKFVADEATATFTAEVNTGYTFDGWFYNSDYAVGHKYADNGDDIDISGEDGEVLEISSIGADKSVYAKFTAKTYNVALDMQSGAEGYGSGSNRNETVTYNATLTTVGSLPTAANGYAFMGFYSGTGGKGTQFINASGTWATSVADTISDSKWVLDAGATTLYAYYKKAEITELTVSPSTVGTGEEVTATPTIYPTPTGSYKVCWKILRNNGNVLTEDGFSEGDDDAVTFDAPTVSGTYKVACVLRTGSACNGGIVLDSVVTDFVVAGIHTVAVRYQDTDGRTLAASTEVSAKPLEWSDDITAPSITGYTFSYWNAGDGITLKTANNVNPTQIKANYGGNLTAVYTKKKMVYFNNTLGWSDVYVYFYNDGDGDEYWANNYGTGANKQQLFNGHKPYWEAQFGHMTQIEGTDIWYYDYLAAGVPSGRTKVAFATVSQSINKSGASNDEAYFHNASVVYRTDFDGTNLPMFVPINSVVHDYTANTGSKYYRGYWMNYPNNTGYTLKIFDKVSGTPAPVQVQSIPFEFTGDLTMPMSVTAELEGGRTYGFKIYRNDATWWGNNGTMKISSSGDTGQAVWEFTTDKNNCGLTTSVAGDYTFTLTYGAKSGTYYYLVGVHYPVAQNDYRIMYKDLATWSQGSAHTAAWGHPSRAIHKEDGAKDIVSFYVSKATGASATMKFQYASAISNEGVVTWTDVTSGSIDLSGIEKSGVYNFHLTQADGAINVEKIEKYDGNYYIRTDCAGTTKWDNYRADDHKMSYSEFSMSPANSFGEKYSHYYTHWCPRGTNVKFVVANDYSSCVSDTLIRDVGDPYSNIYENDGGGRADGELKAESYSGTTPSSDPTADKYSANIRFMYNESTNKISRAYLSSSTNQSRKFLVLKGEAEFWNSDGTNLSGTGESHANHEAIFVDDEDWIYEREIKVTPGTLFKLYACYAQSSPDASTAQYFRGSYDSGDFTEDVNSIVLIGGTGSASKTRIVYDFKTNRLMAAYQPEEGDIDGVQSIKADIMLVREHQEAGQQLTFKDESSKLTEVKTVYGVMRFNRWTLNNRANPEDHDKDHSDTDGDITTYHPLLDAGSQKSTSERGLYWISFPFDVNLSEVFGFGTYGRHWAIMYYDGAARAEKGYWTDSEGFWEFYEDRKDVTLEAGKGYVLGLDLDLMKANDRDFWANEIQQVELFFPSTASAGTIQQTNATVSVPSHECTIDRTGNNGSDINKNRKIADSHWNVIGVPSYANYGSTLSDGTNTITWHAPNTNNLPFLYEWNMADNSYTPQTGSTYSFKAMHAYMVQYQGTLVWSLASATPSSPVARRAADLPQRNIEFRLELQQNDKMTDQTFVKLSDNEEVSANFAFDEDMMKEMNQGKANIYTMVEGYIPTAGNTLPMREQTTVVPVGVKIATNGDYTFSIPDGTSGVGVTLIDTENNIRTNLSAVDYTVSLESGQNDNRFVLEISPIQHIATEIETSDIGDQQSDVRKLLIDGLLYIVRDGKVYDARGARIE